MPGLDDEIKRDVVDQLHWDDRVVAEKIKVDVSGGTAQLTGTVPSYSSRRAAEDDAWSVGGVVLVDNRLKVEIPAGFPATDEGMRENIERAYKWSVDLDEEKMDVGVDASTVTLHGAVNSFWKKGLAEDIAWNEPGVVFVRNQLAIVPTEKVSDELIAQDIVSALKRNAYVSVEDVDVKVENGVVTLLGNVPNRLAERAAYNSALFTTGVRDVRDNLVILHAEAPATSP